MRLSSGLRHALREAANWLGLACIAIGGIIWFDDLKAGIAYALGHSPDEVTALADHGSVPPTDANAASGMVTLKAGPRGHFVANARVNNRPISVLVDTGASMVALSYEDAERAGIFVRPSDFTARVRTANGIAKFAPVTLDSVSIGDITLHDVEAAVSEPGRMGTTLLGMTFIGRLGRAEMSNGVLVLQE